MRIRHGLWLLFACSALASGCQFYFGGDDDGGQDAGPCREGDGIAVPVQQLRNPYTGECVENGGGGPCYGRPYAAGDPATGADVWFDYSWPVCENYCNTLDEGSCLIADGCRAIYVDYCAGGADCGPSSQQFAVCWPVAQTGPVRGGACSAIGDALECAQHDDCSAVHAVQTACGPNQDCAGVVPGAFYRCADEKPGPDPNVCTGDVDCPSDYHCDLSNCPPMPGCTPGQMCPPPVCYGKCVPDQPPPPPPPPPPACEGLGEASCIDMADGCIAVNGQQSCGDHKCEPIYVGAGCTCTAAGVCTCQDWTYQECRRVQ